MWWRQVKCDTCKHLIDKEDAQFVKVNTMIYGLRGLIYCPEHRKPFDELYNYFDGERGYIKHDVKVDVHGTPIGYECIKTKNK